MNQEPVFSVSEFVEYINLAVGRKVVVEGEISSYSVNHGKWIFFDLKDENSKVGCFAAAWNLHTVLEDGMQVQIVGVPRVYGKSGKFSIMVDSVELKGVGSLKRAFELTKAKLQNEGLFDAARKRLIARFPEKIGLICSRESAAYTDFMRIINQRWGGLEITLVHIHVQGESAVGEIVGAVEWFNRHGIEEGIETIVLIRGGGSLEDLQAFNSEPVARAIFGSRIPVVCGVGHERDESLADCAADIRAATPTHAATLVVPDREELGGSIRSWVAAFGQSAEHDLDWHAQRIKRSALSLENAITATLQLFRHVFSQFTFALSSTETRITNEHDSLSEKMQYFAYSAEQRYTQSRLLFSALERTLTNMNPHAVLKRGYSIVFKKGKAIASRTLVKPGDAISVRFADGDLPATVGTPQGKLPLPS